MSAFEESVWLRYLLGPAIVTVPPGLITSFYGAEDFKKEIIARLPSVASFLLSYVEIAITGTMLYPILVIGMCKYAADSLRSQRHDVDELLALQRALDGVVGAKLNRFADCANKVGGPNNTLNKESVFCQITQPMTQTAEIVKGICEYFNAIQTNKRRPLIRVTLAVIKNGKVLRVPICYPQDTPSTATLNELNHPTSAIQYALRSNKIVVIPDIAKEIAKPPETRRFMQTQNPRDNIGSVVCFPVHHPFSSIVPFVISIDCQEAGYFKETLADSYSIVLRPFALRLCLEYSLLVLKETLCEPKQPQEQ